MATALGRPIQRSRTKSERRLGWVSRPRCGSVQTSWGSPSQAEIADCRKHEAKGQYSEKRTSLVGRARHWAARITWPRNVSGRSRMILAALRSQRFSTDLSISGTNEMRGRISVVRAARARTRIVVELIAVTVIRLGFLHLCRREPRHQEQRDSESSAHRQPHSVSHLHTSSIRRRRRASLVPLGQTTTIPVKLYMFQTDFVNSQAPD